MRKPFYGLLCLLLFVLLINVGAGCALNSEPSGSSGNAGPAGNSTGSRPASASADPVRLDVPYVPTPESVVEEMLRIANVGGNDIVYDLGCGDGRIVITAAEKLGARGIGVDLDPDRIKESNENAMKAGVTDRVRFVQADIFEFDITPASVLTLYLLPSVNLELRPKILSDLKPGTRVVSHDFDMDDWKPDHVSRDGIHTIYFWVVPVNATGSWSWTMPGNNRKYELQVSQQFQQVQGKISSGGMSAPIKDAKLVGDQLTFTMEDKSNGKIVPIEFSGRLNGNTIEGAMERSGEPRNDWRAERDPSTVTSIEKSAYVNM